ncbi:hypothetical protein [Falsiroseomonas sp.]|uniref:hypothetical protein n=1 Tax=Falsiroseomonas sp. TaxID=2870721 RepID=UPI003F716CA5
MAIKSAFLPAVPESGPAQPRAAERLSLRWCLAIIGGTSALLWLGIGQIAAQLAG